MGHLEPARRVPRRHLELLGERRDAEDTVANLDPSAHAFAFGRDDPDPDRVADPLRLLLPSDRERPCGAGRHGSATDASTCTGRGRTAWLQAGPIAAAQRTTRRQRLADRDHETEHDHGGDRVDEERAVNEHAFADHPATSGPITNPRSPGSRNTATAVPFSSCGVTSESIGAGGTPA